jgi:hypothetical protein
VIELEIDDLLARKIHLDVKVILRALLAAQRAPGLGLRELELDGQIIRGGPLRVELELEAKGDVLDRLGAPLRGGRRGGRRRPVGWRRDPRRLEGHAHDRELGRDEAPVKLGKTCLAASSSLASVALDRVDLLRRRLGAGLRAPEQPLGEAVLAPVGGRREARAVATHEVVEPQVQDRATVADTAGTREELAPTTLGSRALRPGVEQADERVEVAEGEGHREEGRQLRQVQRRRQVRLQELLQQR